MAQTEKTRESLLITAVAEDDPESAEECDDGLP